MDEKNGGLRSKMSPKVLRKWQSQVKEPWPNLHLIPFLYTGEFISASESCSLDWRGKLGMTVWIEHPLLDQSNCSEDKSSDSTPQCFLQPTLT